jgi:adenosylcobinamide-GDP ribazoletransferase
VRAAIALLTILPVGAAGATPGGPTTTWFPVAGALLAALVIGFDAALSVALPGLVVAALDVAALAVLTGGMHLDGLADSADGLLGGGDRERRLQVMRDPTVGAFAVVAIVVVVVVDVAALASAASRAEALWGAVVASRWAVAMAVCSIPSARADGLGATIRRGMRARHALAATAVASVLVLPLGSAGVASLATAAAAAFAVGSRARRALGGATGDTDGAVVEVAFAGALVAAVVIA